MVISILEKTDRPGTATHPDHPQCDIFRRVADRPPTVKSDANVARPGPTPRPGGTGRRWVVVVLVALLLCRYRRRLAIVPSYLRLLKLLAAVATEMMTVMMTMTTATTRTIM